MPTSERILIDCASAFNFIYAPTRWSHNVEVENTAKFGVYRPSRTTVWDDLDLVWHVSVWTVSILSRANFGTGWQKVWIQEPPNISRSVKIKFARSSTWSNIRLYTDDAEIWRRIHHWSTFACPIWPWYVENGCIQEAQI